MKIIAKMSTSENLLKSVKSIKQKSLLKSQEKITWVKLLVMKPRRNKVKQEMVENGGIMILKQNYVMDVLVTDGFWAGPSCKSVIVVVLMVVLGTIVIIYRTKPNVRQS